ncbi:MAG: ParB N-terminal domain-containing protein, partial [Acidobacteria bacterium]|nr:ParB N-terminal domain-containing protein [Acidobacteriota bacterium]
MTTIESWPISRPLPYARNARKIPEKAVDKVASSIAEFGFQQPLVVDKNGVIIVGHTRLLAAKKLGLEAVPVHVAGNLTEGQVKAYRLMDNRSHEEATWDFDLIAAELCDLQAFAVDLSLTGFDVAELKDLMEQDPKAGLTDEDAAPEVTEDPTTVRGDVWLLGDHRLLCGDAVQASDIETLMAGEQADLVFTDPPYNVAYEGYTEDKLTIKNDAMSAEEFRQFLKDTFVSYRMATKTGASLYVCHP